MLFFVRAVSDSGEDSGEGRICVRQLQNLKSWIFSQRLRRFRLEAKNYVRFQFARSWLGMRRDAVFEKLPPAENTGVKVGTAGAVCEHRQRNIKIARPNKWIFSVRVSLNCHGETPWLYYFYFFFESSLSLEKESTSASAEERGKTILVYCTPSKDKRVHCTIFRIFKREL